MARTPPDVLSAVSAALAPRSGRTLEQWVALVQQSPADPLDQSGVRRVTELC
jgi:hypothetical protein